MGSGHWEGLRGVAEAEGLDAVALVPGSSFRRLMGRSFHSHERPLAVILPRRGAPVAVVPALEGPDFAALDFPGAVFHWPDETGFADAFAAAARALPPVASIGVEGQVMRVFERDALAAAFPGARIRDAGAAIAALRLRKTAEELACLREAVRVSEAAFAATLPAIRAGMTEAEVASLLLGRLFAAGAEALAFHPIVAAGANSANPHAAARADYRIRPGDALLFDFGAAFRGWNADITRTVFVGHAAPEDRALYETVRAANAAGCAAVRPGIPAEAVHAATGAVLAASPFRDCIRHKTGHGLGLDIHEAPQVMAGSTTRLAPGMVFTVEPGLYREGRLGVRIEDDVAVTETGAELLTTLPRALLTVG